MNLQPLYGLRVRTPRLELRLPDDDELVELFTLAETGIHPPEDLQLRLERGLPLLGAA